MLSPQAKNLGCLERSLDADEILHGVQDDTVILSQHSACHAGLSISARASCRRSIALARP
jgi:hypothetical protein